MTGENSSTGGSGGHPIDPRQREADAPHMTVLDLHITHKDRATHPVDGRPVRFLRPGRDHLTNDAKTAKVHELQDRLARGDYVIDPDAVAAAILARLLAGRGR